MEEKKKSSTAIIVILVLIIIGLVGFITYDKLLSKDNSTSNIQDNEIGNDNKQDENIKEEINDDTFNNETIYSQYFETKQEGTVKYFMSLVNSNKDNKHGYFSIRYISVYDSGSEGPLADGYYEIKDGKLSLFVGPYSDTNDETITESVFNMMKADLVVDPNQDWRNATTHPSYYKMYTTEYSEKEIKVGNYSFIKVK